MFDFINKTITYALYFAGVILLLILVAVFRRRKAARIAAENQRKHQEEMRQFYDDMQAESARAEREAKQAAIQRQKEIDDALDQCPQARQYCLETTQTNSTVKTLNITEFTAVSKKRYIAFDLETTGLNHMDDAIVEIGAVLVENGVITQEYSQLVDPCRPMPPEASSVNHITDNMLRGQPQIHQVLPSFLSFVGDDVLVAHNAPFDIRFLSQACMRNRFRVPSSCFDTKLLARYWPEAEDKKLSTLAITAGIDVDNAHRALSDARTLVSFINATNERRAQSKGRSKE